MRRRRGAARRVAPARAVAILQPLRGRVASRARRSTQREVPRQRRALLEGIEREARRAVGVGDPRDRVERQPEPHRRVARMQVATFAAQEPVAAAPAAVVLERQGPADHLVEALVEDAGQPRALERILEPALEGVDVGRQPALAPEVVPDVLVGGHAAVSGEAERLRQGLEEAVRVLVVVSVVALGLGEQARIAPQRNAVRPRITTVGPARQLLARIPLSPGHGGAHRPAPRGRAAGG